MGPDNSEIANGVEEAARVMLSQYRGARKVIAQLLGTPEQFRGKWWQGMWAHWAPLKDQLEEALGLNADGSVRAVEPGDSEPTQGSDGPNP